MRRLAWWLLALTACGDGPRGDIPPPVQLDSTGRPLVASTPAVTDSVLPPVEPLSLTDRTWELATLGDGSAPPPGAGGRRATLRVETAGNRLAGYTGCNRYSGSWRRGGSDSLRFGAIAMTRMACAEGDALERVLQGLLPRVTNYSVQDTILVLAGFGTPLARFVPQVARGRAAAELAR